MEKEFVDEGIKIIFIGFGVTEDRGQENEISLEFIQESRPQVQLDNVVYNKIRIKFECLNIVDYLKKKIYNK